MKKILILALLMVLSFSFTYSQNFSYGFEIGANSTNLDYDKDLDFWNPEYRYSLNGMFFIETGKFFNLNFQSGIRYVQLGSLIKYEDFLNIDGQDIVVKGKHELIQSYLSIPIKIKYKLSELPLSLFIGPELGYLIESDYKHDQESPNPSKSEEKITDKLNRLNISINLGVGYYFTVIGQNFYLSPQYSYGITGIAKENEWFSDWTTHEISINFGYYLPL